MHQTFDAALGMNLLHVNQADADHNRGHLDRWGIVCLNLMSGPGAGKTQVLERTLQLLPPNLNVAVIEGDMTTELDAERLRRCGVPVIAINTGRACHLDARMVAGGLHQLEQIVDPQSVDLVFVENVGNLVCPAEFEVGEHAKVALLSVAEGEDKPLKYPIMFREADCVLITKIDLVPYLDIELDRIMANVRAVNPHVHLAALSAKTGEGFGDWMHWITQQLTEQTATIVRA